jgi:hypothetical protein
LALEALRDLESGDAAALAAAIRKLGAIAVKGIEVMWVEESAAQLKSQNGTK